MKNFLIKASAGTGKTFALATHAIRLMLSTAEPRPYEFVGLTFSRAAAGEIFNRIATRLAKATASEGGAHEETKFIMENIPPEWATSIWQLHQLYIATTNTGERYLKPDLFARLLTSLIHTQHISRIGTTDSFMAQMVKAFPIELGLESSADIMDEFAHKLELEKAADALLVETTNQELFAAIKDILSESAARDGEKTFRTRLLKDMENYFDTFLDNSNPDYWGQPKAIWGSQNLPIQPCGTLSELATELADMIPQLSYLTDNQRNKGLPAVVKYLNEFNGSFGRPPTAFSNMFDAWKPDNNTFGEFKCERITLEPCPALEDLLHRIFNTLVHQLIATSCRRTRAICELMHELNKCYTIQTRQRGRLTFNDIPRLISELDDITRLHLEYRFDSKLTHWALDEFQDTSHLQWDSIKPLITEAQCDTQTFRTTFVVGDMKQAIYGWRGGDISIFRHEAERKDIYQIGHLTCSHRYTPLIADFVNTIFSSDKISDYLAKDAPDAADSWEKVWEPHSSAVKRDKDTPENSWIQLSTVADKDSFADSIAKELLEIQPWKRKMLTAILVNTNPEGALLAEELRKREIPVTWEGESSIADTPVVEALLNLLYLADHPNDTLAFAHLQTTPLSTSPLFAAAISQPTPTEQKQALIRQVATDLSRLGLARTLRNYAEPLKPGFDNFTTSRIESLINAAALYEESATPEMTPTDFVDYLRNFSQRSIADTTVVRIITIHRSKGLGFDYVILPIMSNKSIATMRSNVVLKSDDNHWLLAHPPPRDILNKDPTLSAAYHNALNDLTFEALCKYYVAMTRTRLALSIYAINVKGKESSAFAKYLANSFSDELPYTAGNPQWYEHHTISATPTTPTTPATPAILTFQRPPRTHIQRDIPAMLSLSATSASTLFQQLDKDAAQRGLRIHELLSQITWLDDTPQTQTLRETATTLGIDLTTPTPFTAALTDSTNAVDLWRERSFELLLNNRWISGAFDRVVFRRHNNELFAEIYDFKSNQKSPNETTDTFEHRLKTRYAPQMQLYAQALSALANIPPTHITTTLLLTTTLTSIPIPNSVATTPTSSGPA